VAEAADLTESHVYISFEREYFSFVCEYVSFEWKFVSFVCVYVSFVFE